MLSVPNFRRYFVGQTISQFGDRLVPVALAFGVLDLTHSVVDLSIVLTSQSVAQLVFFLAAAWSLIACLGGISCCGPMWSSWWRRARLAFCW